MSIVPVGTLPVLTGNESSDRKSDPGILTLRIRQSRLHQICNLAPKYSRLPVIIYISIYDIILSQLIFWVRISKIHITLGCNFCLIDQYWCSIFLSFGLHCSNLTHPIRSLIILTLFYIFTWSFQICEIFGPISKNSRPFFGLSVKSCLSFFHKNIDSGQSIFVIWSFASVFCNLMLWGATALTVKHFFKKNWTFPRSLFSRFHGSL